MFALLIGITLCAAVWLLLQDGRRRVYGAVLGLLNCLLWIFAAGTAGAYPVAIVAGICALQFLCFLCATATIALGGKHAH